MLQREGLLSRNLSNQELRERERERMGNVGGVAGGKGGHGLSPSSHNGSGGNDNSHHQSPTWQPRFVSFKRDGQLGVSPGGTSTVVGVVSEIVKPLVSGGGGGGGVGGGGGSVGAGEKHAGDGDGLGHVKGKNSSHHKRTPRAVKLALVAWLLGCSLVIVRVYSAADERVAALANLYYQAPAIVLMALWLWVRGNRGRGQWGKRRGKGLKDESHVQSPSLFLFFFFFLSW